MLEKTDKGCYLVVPECLSVRKTKDRRNKESRRCQD